jgi:hypothetical protein
MQPLRCQACIQQLPINFFSVLIRWVDYRCGRSAMTIGEKLPSCIVQPDLEVRK